MGNLQTDPTAVRRCPDHRPGLALPRPVPLGGSRLGRGRMGRLNRRAAREVLPAHTGGPTAAQLRDRELAGVHLGGESGTAGYLAPTFSLYGGRRELVVEARPPSPPPLPSSGGRAGDG